METKIRLVAVIGALIFGALYTLPTYLAYRPGGTPEIIEKKINLGLDLQGGMYLDIEVQIEAALEEVVQQTAQELEDIFLDNLVDYLAVEPVGDRQIVIDFAGGEDVDLGSETYERFLVQFDVTRQGNQVTLSLKDEEVKRIFESAPKQAIEVLRNRIDGLGISEPSIQQHGERNIIIQLPGLKNREQALDLIGPQAVLEFYLVDDDATARSHNPLTHVIKNQEIRDNLTGETIQRIPMVMHKRVLMTGEVVRDAQVRFSYEDNQPYVSVSFDSIGTDRFGRLTSENVGRRVAIVMDDKVQSAPVIREAITGGEASISGGFTTEEASNLALVLRSGALPAPIEIREERTVGASLGEDSVRQGLNSLLIGGAVVLAFMTLYYRVAGLFASLALLMNVLLIIAVLSAFGATLTLPGMAGVVLTIGMSVDANVLIFQRIREELRRTGQPRSAVVEGFNRAFLTIVDANITTLFGALALAQFGTGPIKGFAITLTIGILTSMFTAIVGTRLFFDLVYLNRKKLKSISI